MSTQKHRRYSNISRMLTVCVMALCLAAGAVSVDGAVYGADTKGSSPFDHTGRSTYYHNGRFSGSLIVDGVDISDWQ